IPIMGTSDASSSGLWENVDSRVEEHATMHQVQSANHGVSTRALGQLFMMLCAGLRWDRSDSSDTYSYTRTSSWVDPSDSQEFEV
ncbi:unnamed protein product, partial [Aureobasidium vineae]